MPSLEHFDQLREGLLLDADYVTLDGRAHIRLWVKSQGKTLAMLDPAFEPYFYVVARGEDPDLGLLAKRLAEPAPGLRARRVEEVEVRDGLRTLRALKVIALHPQDVPRLRSAVERTEGAKEHREADIPFAFRYLIDHKLRPMGGIAFRARPSERLPGALEAEHVEARELPGIEDEAKVLAFDLEVYNPRIIPRPREDPVVLISVATNRGLLEVLANEGRGPDECRRRDKELLERFLELLRREDPDVIVTYNGDEFDWPYLLERARHHRLRLDVGRDGSEPQSRQAGLHRAVSLAGRANVDLLRVAERDLGEVKVKTLKNVADFLGVVETQDRVMVPKDRIWQLWDDPAQRPKLVEYARDDARSTLELARKLLPLQAELARMTRIPLDEESKMGRGRQVDFFLLAEAHERRFLAPNKAFTRDEVYEGGLVLEPPRGLHEGVVALDFSSMYPTIMVRYNVSPETHLPNEVAGAFKEDEVWTAPEVGHKFVREPKGFFPAILEELVRTRRGWKQKLRAEEPGTPEHRVADVKQQTLKILTNAFYGYTGWAGARWYKRECAEATTAWGRHLIKQVIEEAKQEGLDVLYGDSVTAERCVTVRDPRGMVRPMRVDQLFEAAAEAGVRRSGPKEHARPGGYQALSLDPKTLQPVWAPITRVIRHRAGKRVFRVAQKLGETRVTEDHSLMTLEGRRLRRTAPQELDGRCLVRVGPVPRGAPVSTIDLLDYLGDYRTSWSAWGRLRTAAVKEDAGRIAFAWSRRSRPVTLPRFIGVASPEFEGLCRLIGAYVAEGSSSTPETTATRMGASIANSDVAWLQGLQRDYRALFHGARGGIVASSPGVRRLRQADGTVLEYQDHTHKLQMMNKLAAVFFRQLCGQGKEGKRLPDFVFSLPERYQRIVLEEMIKGDGSRWADARYSGAYRAKNFSYTTTSLELASGLSVLLGQLGIQYTINHRPSKRAWTFKTSDRLNARWETKVVEEPYDGFVYDLEVEGTNTFVDSCGQVLLHNTDSLFVRDSPKVPGFVERMNAKLPLELDVQSRFEVIFFTGAKKRYAGLTKEGKVVIRGLEVRRGDWCELAKGLQEEVLGAVLRKRDPKAALKLAQDAIQLVKQGKAGVAELTIFKTLSQEPEDYKAKQAHVHAVEKAMASQPGYKVPLGAKIGYVILKAKGPSKDTLTSERAALVEFLGPKDELDLDYYVDKQLVPAAMRVLEFFGFTEVDLKGAPKQQRLQDWF